MFLTMVLITCFKRNDPANTYHGHIRLTRDKNILSRVYYFILIYPSKTARKKKEKKEQKESE